MVITKFATTTNFRPTKPVFDIFYIDFALGNNFFCQSSHFGYGAKMPNLAQIYK